MIDIEKLKNHFKDFKNSGLANSKSMKDRTDAFERFCQKGIPTLKQEYWKYSPLSKDLAKFENLKFSLNQDEYFDKANYEKFDHYRIVIKDGVLISIILMRGIEITKYKKDNFYEIKKIKFLILIMLFYVGI